MTDEEFKSYRFSSGEEPSDELLAELMRRAGDDARQRGEQARKRFFDKLREMCDAAKERARKSIESDNANS